METRATADVDGIQLPRLIRLSDRKQTPFAACRANLQTIFTPSLVSNVERMCIVLVRKEIRRGTVG
jgi:hypothetical protein